MEIRMVLEGLIVVYPMYIAKLILSLEREHMQLRAIN